VDENCCFMGLHGISIAGSDLVDGGIGIYSLLMCLDLASEGPVLHVLSLFRYRD
jgi:hypothetical protein